MTRLLANCRKLKYSLYTDEQPVYELDGLGYPIYDNIDGEEVPRIIGYKSGYGNPVEFIGNISFAGGETESDVFGISQSDYDAKLAMARDALPITETSLIFEDSEPQYNKDGTLKETSADYRVKKIAQGRYDTVYLLKRIVHNA